MPTFAKSPAARAMPHRQLAAGPIVWIGIIAVTCLLLVLFQYVLWLIVPVMIAIVAYYILSPLVDVGVRRGLTRARAVIIVTILLTLFLILLGLIFAPKVSATIDNLPQTISEYTHTANTLFANAQRTLSKKAPMLVSAPVAANTSVLSAPANGQPAPTTAPAAPGEIVTNVADLQARYSGDVLMEAARWVPSLLLVPCITYFLLLDGPRFKRFIVQAIPNAFFEKTLYLFYRVEDQLRRYFQGLMALTFLDALCLGIGLWIFGLHEPFLLAAIAAVMAWVPYLGSICGGLLVVLVAAHDFPDPRYAWLPYEVVFLFIGVRMLDDFIFLPLTVGRSLHVHPLVTMLMFLLGGAVAGIAGLLLVMPVLGVVMVAGQIIGELLTDERILARHRHAQYLRRKRARVDLFDGADADVGL